MKKSSSSSSIITAEIDSEEEDDYYDCWRSHKNNIQKKFFIKWKNIASNGFVVL